ncbi:hypothetical protein DPMN_168496 [Dreissena polymorpha]|uniref:Uncharacterized protein n=1 Tax=Dreissena polymorpha TaxID=45954 RepID=A0A9D4F0S0_DREPO|nr:hypothetical protein DPMN_168496 [Dreissena polymorpha]
MAPVTQLSQFFQTENVDVGLVQVKLDLCLADLEKVKSLDSPHSKKLMEDLPHDSSTFKGQHYITRTNFKLEDLANEFVDSLIDNIKAR